MKRIIALLLAAMFILACASCGKSNDTTTDEGAADSSQVQPDETTADDDVEQAQDEPDETEPEPTEESYDVNIGFLVGPTGVGASYMLSENDAGLTKNHYNLTLESDPSNIVSAVISGSLDIAAVPTNVAATLYNKTEKNVQIVAINTLNVLYILENGQSINSVADLAGKTIYATGQGSNPEYVLNYVLSQNGLEVGTDVTVEFMDSAELATQMAEGMIDICMLPVPAATSVLVKNENVRTALSIGDEWSAVTDGNTLTQGCVIVRADLENKDAIIANFLEDYGESIAYMTDEANLDDAAQLTVDYGIIAAAPIAKKAIPDCNITFIAGAQEIKDCLSEYYEILFQANPASIGGALPDDGIYYGG
jgi:NitT/TauT family transport system substrate-binding protein